MEYVGLQGSLQEYKRNELEVLKRDLQRLFVDRVITDQFATTVREMQKSSHDYTALHRERSLLEAAEMVRRFQPI